MRATPSNIFAKMLKRGLTWAGSQTFASQIVSTVATSTAPLSIASVTKVSNLNVDQVDSLHADAAATADAHLVATNGSGVITAAGVTLGATALTVTGAEINTLDLSTVGALVKIKKIHVAAGDWTAETDTTFDLPAKSVVLDVFLDVTTQQAGKTVDVGTLTGESGGDPDGFIDGASLATAGLVRPGCVLGATFYNTTTRGALLAQFFQGTDADDRGLYTETPYLSTANTAKSVSYSTGEVVTAVFDIYIVYIELG